VVKHPRATAIRYLSLQTRFYLIIVVSAEKESESFCVSRPTSHFGKRYLTTSVPRVIVAGGSLGNEEEDTGVVCPTRVQGNEKEVVCP
jgi:hypothetical protein